MAQQITLYRIHNHSFIPDFGPAEGYSFTPNEHSDGSDDGPQEWTLPEGYTVVDVEGMLSLFDADGQYAGAYGHGSGILVDKKTGLPYIPIGYHHDKLYLTRSER